MRLLADESVETLVVARLRAARHEVFAITEMTPGAVDERVLALAESRGLILITNDKDFAHLAFRQQQQRWEPKNPAPPVTNTYFCRAISLLFNKGNFHEI